MPRPIGEIELNVLRAYVNAGAAGRSQYYQTLEDWGYRYGRLAGDVVESETINGRLANAFLAEMGVRREGVSAGPVWIDSLKAQQISAALMEADFAARSAASAASRSGIELSPSVIEAYHVSIFAEFGLSSNAW